MVRSRQRSGGASAAWRVLKSSASISPKLCRQARYPLPSSISPSPLLPIRSRSSNALLARMSDSELGPLLDRLEDYELEFPNDPTGALIALANLRPRLPPGGRLLTFGTGPELRLDRVLLRLLRKVEPEERREAVLKSALPEISTLSARMWAILHAGHRENVGSKLISGGRGSRRTRRTSSADPRRFGRRTRHGARTPPSPSPAEEGGRAHRSGCPRCCHGRRNAAPRCVARKRSSVRLSTTGDGVTRVEYRLPWASFEALTPPDNLRARVTSLVVDEGASEGRTRDVVQLAKRYADGWRPEPFDQEPWISSGAVPGEGDELIT